MKETEIDGRELNLVDAEFVKVSQSSIRSVEGGHIELNQVGALSIDGERIEAEQSAACIIRGEKIKTRQGITCISYGNRSSVDASLNAMVIGKEELTIKNSASIITAGNSIKAENTRTLFLLTRKVEGNIQTLFDWKSTLSLGAILTGLVGFFSLIRKR